MTETNWEHCKISKKEDALFETVSQWNAERSITLIHFKNKDQKCSCLFFILIIVFHFGKATDRREDWDLSVKICTGLKIMASHRISGWSLDLLNSLLPHEKHIPVWLLMASRLMLPTYCILYKQTSSSLCLLRTADCFRFWAISCKTHILSNGTSVAIQYTVIMRICN